MTSRIALLVLWAVVGGGVACGHGESYRTSGPALSKEGVQISVAAERCSASAVKQGTAAGERQLDLALNVQLKNHSDNPALVAMDRFKISDQQGPEPVTMKPVQSGVLTLLPGETRFVDLSFQQRGHLDCQHELSLDPSEAVQMSGRKLVFQPIRLTPVK